MDSIFYFAYGSNMSVRRLHQRVNDVRPIGVAQLREHKLEFHKRSDDGSGKCDVNYTGNAKHIAYGVVFEITPQQLLILDEFEGLGKGYDRKEVQIITQSSEAIMAITYYATDIDSSMKPYQWYKEHVLRGARENHLPADYIDQFLNVTAVTDANIKRHENELMIYQ